MAAARQRRCAPGRASRGNLPPHATLEDIALTTTGKPGTYGATGAYGVGCASGVPLSQAACTSATSVTSNSVSVAN